MVSPVCQGLECDHHGHLGSDDRASGVPLGMGLRPTAFASPLLAEVQFLLVKLAIEPVPSEHHGTGFYSRYFLVPKPDGGVHPILDLRDLNTFLRVTKFRMTSLQSIFPFLHQGAYFHVSIHPSCRRFLRFVIGGLHYQYVVLLFGLSTSPRVFSKCVIVIATHLRLQGIRIFQYLDDWLLVAPSELSLRAHLRDTLNLLPTGARSELGKVLPNPNAPAALRRRDVGL